MVTINLNHHQASDIVGIFNNATTQLKVVANGGGFAWVEDSTGLCVENGFCLTGNTIEVQKQHLQRLAKVIGVAVYFIN